MTYLLLNRLAADTRSTPRPLAPEVPNIDQRGRCALAGGGAAAAAITGSYDHAIDGVALTLNRLAAHLLRQGREVLVLGRDAAWLRKHRPGWPRRNAGAYRPCRHQERVPADAGLAAGRAASPETTVVHWPCRTRWAGGAGAEANGVPVLCSHHTRWNAYLAYYPARAAAPPLEAHVVGHAPPRTVCGDLPSIGERPTARLQRRRANPNSNSN